MNYDKGIEHTFFVSFVVVGVGARRVESACCC